MHGAIAVGNVCGAFVYLLETAESRRWRKYTYVIIAVVLGCGVAPWVHERAPNMLAGALASALIVGAMIADTLWSLANMVACGAIAYFVGFPRARAGRHVPLRTAIARTLVASMAAAICVSVTVHRYAAPFEVVLNMTLALAAWARRGDILVDEHRLSDATGSSCRK